MRVDLQSTKNGTSAKLLIFKPRCEYCRRRVAVLYGGEIFACRHRHNLAYPCQRKSADDQATRRADKIRAWLDWEPGILNGKGVHWRTYRWLSAEHDRFVRQALIGALARFGRLTTGEVYRGYSNIASTRWTSHRIGPLLTIEHPLLRKIEDEHLGIISAGLNEELGFAAYRGTVADGDLNLVD